MWDLHITHHAIRALTATLLVSFSLHAQTPSASQGDTRPGYAGIASCTGCHKEQSEPYAHTAHHLTSQLSSRQAIHGSFNGDANVLEIVKNNSSTGEPQLFFTMTATLDGFSETASTGYSGQLQHQTAAIDIVTGSGKRGQTFLSWTGDRLTELPISYWTEANRWINSPGYIDGTANFARPVHPGCIECHATFLQPLSNDPATHRFVRSTFVPGLSCESCHGPGQAHALSAMAQGASAKSATSLILNPAHFTRERQIDLCALCHSGISREPLAPAFSYLPGKPLSVFFKPLPSPADDYPDVHGNQVGLLKRSRCYTASSDLTCSTCHNTHGPERIAATYSDRCLTCHSWQSCGVSKIRGSEITKNCIDCHMPVMATASIVSETAGMEVRASMRTHWIKVYPDAHLP